MKTMTDLGWMNEQGETERRIIARREECHKKGHTMKTVNVGMYGTIHDTSCLECGYVFHTDSGD